MAVSQHLTKLGLLLDADPPWTVKRVARTRGTRPGHGFVDAGSCLVRYRDHGNGPRTFVFAADPPVVLEHYDRLVEALSPHGRVIVLELPGFGFSPVRLGFDFSMEGVTEAVEHVLVELRVRDALLCFPCGSAYLALTLSARAPRVVQGLVLSQAPSFDGIVEWKERRDPKGVLARPFLGQCAMHALKRRRAPAWFSVSVGKQSERAWMQSVAEDSLRDGARWSLASAFQRFLVAGGAPPVAACKVLALWGTLDRSHAETRRESSRSLGTDVELVEWNDVGHFPDLEEPARFATLVTAFRG
ncbi:MAG TPA: alpha/beta hydrolase [Polyangiaceae bacterium]|jgi:pimeloyl-ACP methyl ester carboxylesterase|nr:alpha/beta hydrolase [Polyangiaceae bacterium]